MKPLILLLLAVSVLPGERLSAQRARVTISGGDVVPGRRVVDSARLAPRIPGVPADAAARIRVGGDSAQRIALDDFGWKGRVSSVEIDEADARVFWDIKIVPDSLRATIVRYRVDAASGGIIEIKEFTGIRGLARRP
jgi:hypothetical protein